MIIDPHRALIYTMVLVSAADGEVKDEELDEMSQTVTTLRVFKDIATKDISPVVEEVMALLQDDEGLDTALKQIGSWLPSHLRETAYAIACDVAAADGVVVQEEARLLEMLRFELTLDRLVCAAIERGARARHASLTP